MFPVNLIQKSYYRNVDAAGLAVFRIVYGITLFLQICFISYFQKLIFVAHTPYAQAGLVFWLGICFLLIIGYKTRLAAVFNYLFTVLILNSLYGENNYVYDYDKIMIAVNFLLMFLPVSRVWSVDNLLIRRKSEKGPCPDGKVSVLYYYLPLFSCLGIPYIDSVYHKFLSVNWLSGVGIWVPMSMPQMTWPPFWDFSLILNNRFLSNLMNYLTMLFELVFIFTFWFRKMRPILFVVGVGFHVGILFIYPIPLFALGCSSLYILLLPPEWWRKLKRPNESPGVLEFNAINGTDRGFKLFKAPAQICFITLFFFLTISLQLGYFFDYVFDYTYGGKPYLIQYKHNYSQKQWRVLDYLIEMNQRVLPYSKMLLGIGPHDVMLDNQCENYNLILAIVYKNREGKEIWLPIIDKDGHPGYYVLDRGWSKWTHYVRWYNIRRNRLQFNKDQYRRKITQAKNKKNAAVRKSNKPVLIRFVEFWCAKNNIPCEEGKFTIKERYVIAAEIWQKDIMQKQKSFDWADIGTIEFKLDTIQMRLFGDSENEHMQFQR